MIKRLIPKKASNESKKLCVNIGVIDTMLQKRGYSVFTEAGVFAMCYTAVVFPGWKQGIAECILTVNESQWLFLCVVITVVKH